MPAIRESLDYKQRCKNRTRIFWKTYVLRNGVHLLAHANIIPKLYSWNSGSCLIYSLKLFVLVMLQLISEFHIFVFENLAVVKIKMLPILISRLIISSAVTTSVGDSAVNSTALNCNVGPVNFTGFDIDKVRDSDMHDFQDGLDHKTCVY